MDAVDRYSAYYGWLLYGGTLKLQTNEIVITYTDGTYERIKNSDEKLANLRFKMIISNLLY